MIYQPNFNDPRVINRIRHAYGFTRAVISERPHRWSTRYIDRYFGQQQTALSKWLRCHLLIPTSHSYSQTTGQTKEYKLNISGADYVRNILLGRRDQNQNHANNNFDFDWQHIEKINYDRDVVLRFIKQEWGSELVNRNFTYEDKSHRLWHPLQNVRRQQRALAFADYNLCYQYDIECAAPTLIHQHAQQQPDPMDLYLFALRNYLNDRQQIRQTLSQALEVDIKTAKVIINALFCGARIGHGADFAISQLLDNDAAKIQYLKQDTFIQQLRADIKTCWLYIQPSMMRIGITDKRNRHRLLPVTSKQKWQRYFDLERRCLNAIRNYLDQTQNHYFLEHDGWTCEREIDLTALTAFVHNSTGFNLKFELKKTFTGIKRREKMEDLINEHLTNTTPSV